MTVKKQIKIALKQQNFSLEIQNAASITKLFIQTIYKQYLTNI